MRRRKLPAEHVVWLVIGMGLFRDRSVTQVVHHLDLVLPTPRGDRRRITNAAIVRARDQVGAAPLAALFWREARDVGPALTMPEPPPVSEPPAEGLSVALAKGEKRGTWDRKTRRSGLRVIKGGRR